MFLNLVHNNPIQSLPLAGCLKYFSHTWEKITQDPWVLQVLQVYQIEFIQPPVQLVQASMPNLPSALEVVLDQEVRDLLDKQAVHVVEQQFQTEGFISSLFVVPKKGGGNRPVVNLKPLNQFLIYKHFKKEGIHMLRDLLNLAGQNRSLERQHARICLPHLRVFTKLRKPIVALFKQRGIRLIIYLDDILIMGDSQDLVLDHTASTLNLLSQLDPSQQIVFRFASTLRPTVLVWYDISALYITYEAD